MKYRQFILEYFLYILANNVDCQKILPSPITIIIARQNCLRVMLELEKAVVRIPVEAINFYFLQNFELDSGAKPAPYSTGTGERVPEVKRPEHEV